MKKLLIILFAVGFGFVSKAQIECVVIRWNNDSTKFTPVNLNYTTMQLPIVGLEPGLEVLVKRIPYQKPDNDERLVIYNETFFVSDTFDTEYPTNRCYNLIYSEELRSASDKVVSVKDAEQLANAKIVPSQQHLGYTMRALAAIWRKANGLTNTPGELEFMNIIAEKALRINKNNSLANQKIDSLNAGNVVDLDYGWEDVDPEAE